MSYDRLIDEVWVQGRRRKQRWSVQNADSAVRETVEAARFLADRREDLAPRRLVLSCQGVDSVQYAGCAAEVLRTAQPGDWLGLGGWCILGRFTSWLPEFWRTLEAVLPMAAAAGIDHVHIFGVLYGPALGGMLWLADRHGLTCSTDSTKPVLDCTWPDAKKAGLRAEGGWRANVAWWRGAVAGLRESPFYRPPPSERQLVLF